MAKRRNWKRGSGRSPNSAAEKNSIAELAEGAGRLRYSRAAGRWMRPSSPRKKRPKLALKDPWHHEL